MLFSNAISMFTFRLLEDSAAFSLNITSNSNSENVYQNDPAVFTFYDITLE